MKRPMCILAVSWLAGLCLAGLETGVGTNVILVFYFLFIILGLLVLKKNPRLLKSYVNPEWYLQLTLLLVMIPCVFLGGYFRADQAAGQRTKEERPWKLLEQEGESYVMVEGTVKAKAVEEEVIIELTDCEIIGYYGQNNQPTGDCRVRIDGEGKEWLQESVPGNRIRVFGTFSTFRPAGNPGQFDAYDYYTGRGLYADITALKLTVLDDMPARGGQLLFVLKQRLRESIRLLYPEEKAGVLVAMLLGDKDLLPEEIETMYRQNGISHILAISGLHISMLCMGLFRLLRKLTAPLWLSAAISVSFLLFYVCFTGMSTSSVRAAVMCLAVFGAKLTRRSYDLLSSLSFAAVAVTAVWPFELTSAGFLLSFGAVLGVVAAKELEARITVLHDGKRPGWCIFLFGGMIQCVTMPVSLWFFYELSPYGIFLNLVVIPLVSLIIGGGLMSAVLGLWWPVPAKLPVGGTYLLLEFYERLCEITRKLPFSFVLLGRPQVWQLAVYYGMLAVILWWFFRNGSKMTVPGSAEAGAGKQGDRENFKVSKELAAGLGLLCTAAVLLLPPNRNTEFLFMDVSQGDGVLITTPDGTVILSDCGSSDITQLGEYRLSPLLKHKGILLVDMAVVSHMDTDHISGIRDLLRTMPEYEGDIPFAADYAGNPGIKELVLPVVEEKSEAYLELETLADAKNVTVRYIQAGDVLHREEKFLAECLSPYQAGESDNDTSLVFLLQTPNLLAWLTGDAGTASEADVISRLNSVDMDSLCKDKPVLLKVGHHGSKTSSGQEFIEFVQPDAAVISCGYHNSYGHPHDEVVERLVASGAEVFRTDLQGAISVEVKERRGVVVFGWRKSAQKYVFCKE